LFFGEVFVRGFLAPGSGEKRKRFCSGTVGIAGADGRLVKIKTRSRENLGERVLNPVTAIIFFTSGRVVLNQICSRRRPRCGPVNKGGCEFVIL
jgi:hypothetical protein